MVARFCGEWKKYKLDEVFRLYTNNTLSRDKLSTHGVIGNIHYGDVLIKYGHLLTNNDDIPRIKAEFESEAKTLLRLNDIVIADTAEDETVGKAVQIGNVSFPLAGGLHTIICRPLVTTATGYLGYYMNSKYYHDQLLPYITGIKVSSISRASIRKTEITLPPMDEQIAIAETLSAFDRHLANLSELIAKKKAIRQGALEDLTSGRTRLSGFSGDWRETTIGEEYIVIMGQSPASSSYNDRQQGIPFVQGNADIVNHVTVPKRYTSEPTKICKEGATILSVRAPVGTISRANQTICLGRGVCAIVGEPQDFVFYLMQYHENSWKNLEQGSTFKAVNAETVKDFKISLPPVDEQTAIADTLAALDTEISALNAEHAKLSAIRQGAINDLLSGKIRLAR